MRTALKTFATAVGALCVSTFFTSAVARAQFLLDQGTSSLQIHGACSSLGVTVTVTTATPGVSPPFYAVPCEATPALGGHSPGYTTPGFDLSQAGDGTIDFSAVGTSPAGLIGPPVAIHFLKYAPRPAATLATLQRADNGVFVSEAGYRQNARAYRVHLTASVNDIAAVRYKVIAATGSQDMPSQCAGDPAVYSSYAAYGGWFNLTLPPQTFPDGDYLLCFFVKNSLGFESASASATAWTIESAPPTVQMVTRTTPAWDGNQLTLSSGETVKIGVVYGKRLASAIPSGTTAALTLSNGATATFSDFSPPYTLNFTYTVQPGDASTPGFLDAASLNLGGLTVLDYAGNQASPDLSLAFKLSDYGLIKIP